MARALGAQERRDARGSEANKAEILPRTWMGEPNSLNSGKAVVNLAAGEEFTWEMRVTALKSDG